MKNGIDVVLILVLLATIGLLVYFGLGNVSTVTSPTATVVSDFTETVSSGTPPPVQKPKSITPTLIPASVTIPTNTATITASPTETPTLAPTTTATPTVTLGTDSPTSQIGQEIKSGIQRGNTIVKAIEAYHSALGLYPDSLNALVPIYLPGVPITSTGQAFFYRLFDAGSPLASEVYWVSFRAINQDHVACTYLRRLDYWDCDFASP